MLNKVKVKISLANEHNKLSEHINDMVAKSATLSIYTVLRMISSVHCLSIISGSVRRFPKQPERKLHDNINSYWIMVTVGTAELDKILNELK